MITAEQARAATVRLDKVFESEKIRLERAIRHAAEEEGNYRVRIALDPGCRDKSLNLLHELGYTIISEGGNWVRISWGEDDQEAQEEDEAPPAA